MFPLLLVALATLLETSHASAREVTDQTGRRVNIPERAQRLVSLAPSITETLYALGIGGLLVGVTDYCDYPPEARLKPRVGSVLNPNLERIVALRPDLVLGSTEVNRLETADRLERLGIPLFGVTAHTLDQALASIEDLGRVLGQEAEARGLVARLRTRVAAVEERIAGRRPAQVLFVVWHRPLTTAGRQTFISDVIRRAGGRSIADDLTGEWPRLSLEEAVRRSPEVILFAHSESFTPNLDEFKSLPGWKDLPAVKNGRMHFISDGIVRPSPRLIDALEDVAAILHPPEARR